MKNIFHYTSYRDFLKDFYTSKKEERYGYTYRDFSKAAGINSSSWLLHLIRGTKNLSDATAETVARITGLAGEESAYFTLLVKFTQAKTTGDKDRLYKRLLAYKERVKVVSITDAQYDYYIRWYHPVVRSLVSKVKWNGDYAVLARCLVPQITASQARKSVRLLLKLGMVDTVSDGAWVQKAPVISTGEEVDSLNVVNYHKQVSELARDAFDRSRKENREISALTLGVSEKEFVLIKEKIRRFRKEIIDIVRGSADPDRVYQLNVQLFPVSRIKGKKP